MNIKFNRYHVTNGEIKARVFYSLDNRGDKKECVTIYARDYDRSLGKIFKNDYINETDLMTDYFDSGSVELFENHPLYSLARKRAEENRKQQLDKLNARNNDNRSSF